jgi:hypothetical protein
MAESRGIIQMQGSDIWRSPMIQTTHQLTYINAFETLNVFTDSSERRILARLDHLRAVAAVRGSVTLDGPGGTVTVSPTRELLDHITERFRRPDLRLIDTLTWHGSADAGSVSPVAATGSRVAALLGRARDTQQSAAQRLKAAAVCLDTLRTSLGEPRLLQALQEVDLSPDEAARLCVPVIGAALNAVLAGTPVRSRAGMAALCELRKAVDMHESFAGLKEIAAKYAAVGEMEVLASRMEQAFGRQPVLARLVVEIAQYSGKVLRSWTRTFVPVIGRVCLRCVKAAVLACCWIVGLAPISFPLMALCVSLIWPTADADEERSSPPHHASGYVDSPVRLAESDLEELLGDEFDLDEFDDMDIEDDEADWDDERDDGEATYGLSDEY